VRGRRRHLGGMGGFLAGRRSGGPPPAGEAALSDEGRGRDDPAGIFFRSAATDMSQIDRLRLPMPWSGKDFRGNFVLKSLPGMHP
jgi:hypothetical protein